MIYFDIQFDQAVQADFTFGGEHIKTWRPRYFVLSSNGDFKGYNGRPTETEAPNNVFFVKGLILLVQNFCLLGF